MKKRLLSILLVLVMLLTLLPTVALALEDGQPGVTTLAAQGVEGVVVGDFVVKGGEEGTDYELLCSTEYFLYIRNNTPLTISMKPNVTETGITIVGENAKSINITLAGVNIKTSTGAPLDLSLSWESKLTLAGGTTNVLKAIGNKPGIYTGTAKLTIDGDGRLDVYGGSGSAGIGGARGDTTGGTIEINGGVINAYGGAATSDYHSGAGIGGSAQSVAGNITINGGTIYAVGGSAADGLEKGGGAGIGGGGSRVNNDIGGVITINGGTLTALGGTGPFGAGAGIGGGGSSSSINSITISDGVINATAGTNGAAGIGGGGHQGTLNQLRITGGFITATGTYKGNTPGDGKANVIGGGAGEQPSDLSGVTGAVIIDGAAKTGRVYGDAVLTKAAEVPVGVTLTVPEGASLTVPEGASLTVPEGASLTVGEGGTLTNKGLIIATGTLTKNGGTITNSGDGEIQYAVAWDLTNINHNKGEGITYANTSTGYSATLSAARSYALPASVTVEVGGTVLSGGYTYNSNSGVLVIDKASVTGNVEITAVGGQLSTGAGVTAVSVSDTVGPISGTVYNADHTIWLTGGGIIDNDLLIVESDPQGSEYDALRALAGGAEVFNTYNIYLRSGKKSTSSAIYLHFDLNAKYTGQAFTLVHMKADKAYEYFTAAADANGDLAFGPLYELSPFMLVKGTLMQTSNARIADVPATGGASAWEAYIALFIAGAAFAVGVTVRKKSGVDHMKGPA